MQPRHDHDPGAPTGADQRAQYFAYGSNMALERFRARSPSAVLICVAVLPKHALRFHKPSKKDGSGKCDAARTNDASDRVFGALYSISTGDLQALDKFEGCGFGYEREIVTVKSLSGESYDAETYKATQIDPARRPLDWYKEHVVRGARALGLPADYIRSIEAIVADVDPDKDRRARELAIYSA